MSEKPRYEIDELIPQRASFKLMKTGDKEHFLRPINMEDRVWILNILFKGDEKEMNRVFSSYDITKIAPIVFHQLEDKTPFLGVYEPEVDDDGFVITDEDGNPKQRKVTGGEQIVRACLGLFEHVDIQVALMKTAGISAPKVVEDVEATKKKIIEIAKKNLEAKINPKPKKRTGAKSTTA